jgi:hypothetical protein
MNEKKCEPNDAFWEDELRICWESNHPKDLKQPEFEGRGTWR